MNPPFDSGPPVARKRTTFGSRLARVAMPALCGVAAIISAPAAQSAGFEQIANAPLDQATDALSANAAEGSCWRAPTVALELTFVRQGADGVEFADGVALRILDAQGRAVVDDRTGPVFTVDLPGGPYMIVASYRGDVRLRNVAIGGCQRHRVSMVWS